MFDIDESNGRILTKAGLNHEDTGCGYVDAPSGTTCTYTMMVQVSDGLDIDRVEEDEPQADDTATLTISVRDIDETPVTPTVTVTAPTGNTTLDVTWDEPENTGPAITEYDVQYREGSGTFSDDNCRNTDVDDNCDGPPERQHHHDNCGVWRPTLRTACRYGREMTRARVPGHVQSR